MPQHAEKRLVPFRAEQMFDLVSDVECYPAFLPWCVEAKVHGRADHRLIADLVVGNNLFQERFTSHVEMFPCDKILVHYGGGALSHLSNEWGFRPVEDGCEISFFVDFSVRSLVLGAMMDLFFERAFERMVSAFESRAHDLYGDMNGQVAIS